MRKKCIVCENIIYRAGSPKQLRQRRGNRAMTCSKYCSKVYTRISQYLSCKIKNKRKKMERKKRENGKKEA